MREIEIKFLYKGRIYEIGELGLYLKIFYKEGGKKIKVVFNII